MMPSNLSTQTSLPNFDINFFDNLQIFANYKNDLTGCLINCSNNGNCKLNQDSFFACVCNKYYGGKSCQVDIRPCSKLICLNNSTCYDKYSSNSNQSAVTNFTYFCECKPGFYGNNCEKQINVCFNETCSDNGYCKINGTEPSCVCRIEHYGVKCEFEDTFAKIVRYTKITVTVMAVLIVGLTGWIILCNDIWNFFLKPKAKKIKKVKKRRPHIVKVPKYIP